MYKVILAEDDYHQRRGIARIDFKALGLRLMGDYPDGQRALEAHKKEAADIIITDIRMPHMSGMDFLKAARDISKETKFILVSAYSEFEYAKNAIDLGVSSYILKPFTKKEMVAKLVEAKEALDSERQLISKETVATYLTEADNLLMSIAHLKLTHVSEDETIAIMGWRLLKPSKLVEEQVNQCRDFIGFTYQDIHYGVLREATEDKLASRLHCIASADPSVNMQVFAGSLIKKSALSEGLRSALAMYHYMYFKGILRGHFSDHKSEVLRPNEAFSIDTTLIRRSLLHHDLSGLQAYVQDLKGMVGVLNVSYKAFFNEVTSAIEMMNQLRLKYKAPSIEVNEMMTLLDAKAVLDWLYEACLSTVQVIKATRGYSDGVKRAMTYVDQHYMNQGLRLQDMAEDLNMSYSALSRDFRSQTGKSFTAYLGQLRIEKAKQLLTTSSLRVNEIAEVIGLSQKNFNRIFAKEEGCTPTEYRREMT